MRVDEAVVVSSAARTTSGQSSAIDNESAVGALFIVDVSSVSGTSPTLDVSIEAQDPASGAWVTIATMSTISTTGTNLLTIHPAVTESAGRKVSDVLPRRFRVAWTIAGTNPSFTFSVSVNLYGGY